MKTKYGLKYQYLIKIRTYFGGKFKQKLEKNTVIFITPYFNKETSWSFFCKYLTRYLFYLYLLFMADTFRKYSSFDTCEF